MARLGLLRRFLAADRCCPPQTGFRRRVVHAGGTRSSFVLPQPIPSDRQARCRHTERALDPAPSVKGARPVADSTEHETNRVTSGRRALIAAWMRQATDLPTLYAVAWADACAALVEDGWPTASRSLLARLLDPTDVDRAGRVLLGGLPPAPAEMTRRRLTHALPELAARRWSSALGDSRRTTRRRGDLRAADARPGRGRGRGCSAVAPGHDRRVPDRRTAALRPGRGRRCRSPQRGSSRVRPAGCPPPLLDAADVVDSVRAGGR